MIVADDTVDFIWLEPSWTDGLWYWGYGKMMMMMMMIRCLMAPVTARWWLMLCVDVIVRLYLCLSVCLSVCMCVSVCVCVCGRGLTGRWISAVVQRSQTSEWRRLLLAAADWSTSTSAPHLSIIAGAFSRHSKLRLLATFLIIRWYCVDTTQPNITLLIYLFIYLFAQAHTLRTIRQGLEQDSKAQTCTDSFPKIKI